VHRTSPPHTHTTHAQEQAAQADATTAAARSNALQRQLEDERLQRQELELELELTVRARGGTLLAADSAWEVRLLRLQQEGRADAEALRAQLEQAEARSNALQRRLEDGTAEAAKLRAANSALQRSRGEAQSLRLQLVALRRGAGRGGPDSSGDPAAQAAAREEGARRLGVLRDAGVSACKRALACAQAAQAARAEASQCRSALHDVLHALVERAAACVSASVPASVSSPASDDYVKISGALRGLEASLQQRLAALAAARQQVTPGPQAPELEAPLLWESSALELSSGGKLEVVLPALAAGQRGNLSWSVSGSAGGIALTLLATQGTAEAEGLPAVSLPVEYVPRDQVYVGELALAADGSPCVANRVLRLENTGWTSARIGYRLLLQHDIDPRAHAHAVLLQEQQAERALQWQQECAAAEARLADTRHKLQRFLSGCDLHFRCLHARKALLQAELRAKRAAPAPGAAAEEAGAAFAPAKMLHECRKALADFTELAYLQAQPACQTQAQAEHGVNDARKAAAAAAAGTAVSTHTEYALLDELVAKDVSVAASTSLSVPILFSRCAPPFLLRWRVELLGNSAGRDVGFCVCRLRADGALPQLLPYRKLSGTFTGEHLVTALGDGAEEQGVAVLIDNTYSWVNGKNLHYTIEMLSLVPQPQGPQAEVNVPDEVMWGGAAEEVEGWEAGAVAVATADDKNVGEAEHEAADAMMLHTDFLESSGKQKQQLLQMLEEALQFAHTYGK